MGIVSVSFRLSGFAASLESKAIAKPESLTFLEGQAWLGTMVSPPFDAL